MEFHLKSFQLSHNELSPDCPDVFQTAFCFFVFFLDRLEQHP